MKKSVVLVIAVLIAIPLFLWLTQNKLTYTSTITGLQTYDFPPPPPPPGMDAPTPPGTPPDGNGGNGNGGNGGNGGAPGVTYPGTGGGGSSSYYLGLAGTVGPGITMQQLQNQTQLIELVYDLARRVAILETKAKILDLMPGFESQIAQLGNIQAQIQSWQRASIEMPAALENIEKMRQRTIFTMILTFLSLLLIVGLIVTMMIQKKKIETEDKEVIKNYLSNYLRSGYRLETLKMHLRASGWEDKIIDDAVQELKGGI